MGVPAPCRVRLAPAAEACPAPEQAAPPGLSPAARQPGLFLTGGSHRCRLLPEWRRGYRWPGSSAALVGRGAMSPVLGSAGGQEHKEPRCGMSSPPPETDGEFVIKNKQLHTVTNLPRAQHLRVNELPLGPKQVPLLLKND